MYQIYCDDYPLYDPRIDDLRLLSARCNLEANTVCGAVLTVPHTHRYYDKLVPLKSIFEIKQDGHVIFRGRMTDSSQDFQRKFEVDLEGTLAYTNDTIISPFAFSEEGLTCEGNTVTCNDGNYVEFFLNWIIEQHNAHVCEWQRLKLGTVNFSNQSKIIPQSSDNYTVTWDVIKNAIDTTGGYLYVRYEDDGNYIDWVESFEYTNTQRVTIDKNVLDISTVSDGNTTYSAILPIGKDGLTIADLDDGNLTDDLVKQGKYIFSRKAVEEGYGWICVPVNESKRDDIAGIDDLRDWAMEYLNGTANSYANTTTIKIVDLAFSGENVQNIKPYQNVIVNIPSRGINEEVFPLPKMDIDILDIQNTTITIGDTVRSLIGINAQMQTNTQSQIESVKYEVQQGNKDIQETVKEATLAQMTSVIAQCNTIILSALESYVETANFEAYKETVSTQLQILADEIVMNFSSTTEHINSVDGDMQSKFTQVYKHIRFADGSITLGSSENAITLTIENDMIIFKRNGLQFGWWDGVDFHTGNIVVEVNERAQFGNFAFVPRSDGSLMFLKVGG